MVFYNNQWYYLNPISDGTKEKMCISDGTKGKIYTRWQLINGKWYYFNEEGALLTDTWIGDYYVDSNGVWIKEK